MDETLIGKLTAIVESQKKLEEELSKVDISNDPKKYAEMAKKHSDMSSIVELFNPVSYTHLTLPTNREV